MRWSSKKPESGDGRTIRRFLFFPRTIAAETRWLEWAKIEQQYENYSYRSFGTLYYDKQWSDVAWGN